MKLGFFSYLKTVMIALLIILIYYNTFIWMEDRWKNGSSYYSHGYLIPFVAGYLIWKERRRICESTYSSSKWGIILFITGICVQIGSVFLRVHFTSGISLILVLLGIVFFFFGKNIGKQLLFPILFLITMVPMPLSVIAGLSLKLKLFAADCAMSIISLIGIPAIQDGSKIYFSNASVVVGDVCSGLKSLIALIAFGALFAYISPMSNYMKPILFIASIPAAMIANIIRIVIVCLVAKNWGTEIASGLVHDLTGILIFIIAFILLFCLSIGLRKLDRLFLSNKNRINAE
ncbi:MAG: exosortase/archaeosortase family protein [Candidatus Scalindua sp.]|nr:exosortase/archaeosortase family protein [Candidatus Scalindua sp.]